MTTSMENKTYIMRGKSSNRTLDKFHLILSPSYSCNMNCKHCYLPSHSNKGLDYSVVQTIMEEWSRIVKLERGRLNGIVHLKGGEPLILPYLYDVFNFLKEDKTCSFMMTTSGVLDDEAFFAEIQTLDAELENSTVIIVSLDGSRNENNALLRGNNSFYKTVQFIKELTSREITVHVNYVVHKKNLSDLEDFINLATSLGVGQINFLKFIPKGFGLSLEDWEVDSVLYNQRMIDVYEAASPEVRRVLSGNLGYVIEQEKCGTGTSCECVGGYKGIFYIVPNGDVFSCPNLTNRELRIGNVHTNTLYDLHENSVNLVYNKIRQYKNVSYLCKEEILKRKQVETAYELDTFKEGASYCYSRNF